MRSSQGTVYLSILYPYLTHVLTLVYIVTHSVAFTLCSALRPLLAAVYSYLWPNIVIIVLKEPFAQHPFTAPHYMSRPPKFFLLSSQPSTTRKKQNFKLGKRTTSK